MQDLELKIMDLINAGYSNNDIIEKLNISAKELWQSLQRLKLNGIFYERKYYYDGKTIYVPKSDLVLPSNEASIITSPKDKKVVILALSDTHGGRTDRSTSRSRERFDLISECYNFCCKEGIHIIIHGGDFIDGFMTPTIVVKNLEIEQLEQIEHTINNYPYDPHILTFTCLGNHDYDVLKKCNQNIALILDERRHDIVPIGYGCGKINIKNDSFLVYHKIKEIPKPLLSEVHTFILKGHSHHMSYHFRSSTPTIYIPALIDEKKDSELHTVLKITINFKEGFITSCVVEQCLIERKFEIISRCIFDVNQNRKSSPNTEIALEEPIRMRKKVK